MFLDCGARQVATIAEEERSKSFFLCIPIWEGFKISNASVVTLCSKIYNSINVKLGTSLQAYICLTCVHLNRLHC